MTTKESCLSAQPVLCLYRIYSAYKDCGYVEGAKMIHVNRSWEILDEFCLQMDLDMRRASVRGQKLFGIQEPVKYTLLRYQPFCGRKEF